MLKEYLPYFEESLGFKLRDAELIPIRSPESDDTPSHYTFRRGGEQFVLRMPASAEIGVDPGPAYRLRDSLNSINLRLEEAGIRSTIPKVAVISDGIMPPAFVESAMRGAQASRWIGFGWSLSRRRTRKVTDMAMEWLESFQRATRTERVSVAEALNTTRSGMELDELLTMRPNPLDESHREILERAAERLRSDRETTVPLTASHGTFSPANVLIEGGQIRGVLQWSAYESEDLPFVDLWHFLVSTATEGCLDPRDLRSHLTRHLLGTGWYNAVVGRAVDRMAAFHEVPRDLVRVFLLLHMVRLALRHRFTLSQETSRGAAWLGLLRRILMFESFGERVGR